MATSTDDHLSTPTPTTSTDTSDLSTADKQSGSDSYKNLIIRAILNNPKKAMTLQEIYERLETDVVNAKNTKLSKAHGGWKNAIRHTLSNSKCFKRISLDPTDSSLKYWTIDNSDIGASVCSLMENCSTSNTQQQFPDLHVDLPVKEKSKRGRPLRNTTINLSPASVIAKSIVKSNQLTDSSSILKVDQIGLNIAAMEIMTGLTPEIFNCLYLDLQTEAKEELRQLEIMEGGAITAKEALILTLLEIRHGDNLPNEFYHLWFAGKDEQWKKNWTNLRERWIPFLACWLDDLIVWPHTIDSKEKVSENLRKLLKQGGFGLKDLSQMTGILDLVTYHVKLSPYNDDCCRWTAIIFIIYDFSGTILFRSPAYWTVCKQKNQRQYKIDLQETIISFGGHNLEKILKPGQRLLTFNDDLNFQLPKSIYFIKSDQVRRILKSKFGDRIKSNFGILSKTVSPSKSSMEILCLNDLITVCCALLNLMPPILWDDNEEDEID